MASLILVGAGGECGEAIDQRLRRNSKGHLLVRKKSYDYYLHPTDRKSLIQLKGVEQEKLTDYNQLDQTLDTTIHYDDNENSLVRKISLTKLDFSNGKHLFQIT